MIGHESVLMRYFLKSKVSVRFGAFEEGNIYRKCCRKVGKLAIMDLHRRRKCINDVGKSINSKCGHLGESEVHFRYRKVGKRLKKTSKKSKFTNIRSKMVFKGLWQRSLLWQVKKSERTVDQIWTSPTRMQSFLQTFC